MEVHSFSNGGLLLLSSKYKHGEVEEDRLSSLPDVILVEILSLLPINSAAATSVLSRSWRHLWTGVTSFEYYDRFTSFGPAVQVQHILSQLTTPIFRKLEFHSLRYMPLELKSFMRLVCTRNVEVIKLTSHQLTVPDCVFTCQTLLTLELDSRNDIDTLIPPPANNNIHLPNLRKLRLRRLDIDNSLTPLATIIRSCPLLQDLCLSLRVNILDEDVNSWRICALNLISLDIDLYYAGVQFETIIDAPKLAYLRMRDRSPWYRFANNPTLLVAADVDFRVDGEHVRESQIVDVAKVVPALLSVRKLKLMGATAMNIFSYLSSVVGRPMPDFRNLTCFQTVLYRGSKGWKDLLLSLQCAPNLEVLEVTVKDYFVADPEGVSSTPDCLLRKIKTIKLSELKGNEVELIGYMLKNAFVLEQLQLETSSYILSRYKNKDGQVEMESSLCEAAFKLPRSSPTSVVVFSGEYIKATSKAIKDGLLDSRSN